LLRKKISIKEDQSIKQGEISLPISNSHEKKLFSPPIFLFFFSFSILIVFDILVLIQKFILIILHSLKVWNKEKSHWQSQIHMEKNFLVHLFFFSFSNPIVFYILVLIQKFILIIFQSLKVRDMKVIELQWKPMIDSVMIKKKKKIDLSVNGLHLMRGSYWGVFEPLSFLKSQSGSRDKLILCFWSFFWVVKLVYFIF